MTKINYDPIDQVDRSNSVRVVSDVFNAFSGERFFDIDETKGLPRQIHSPVDVLVGIDEMISENIMELTHRTHQR